MMMYPTEVESVMVESHPILLIEDNPMDIDLTLQAFQDNKIRNPILICRDGEEALTFIHAQKSAGDQQRPCLVLLDLNLPKIDGLTVLRQARELPIWNKIPFVALTSSYEYFNISEAYELGVNSYIVKPVNFKYLIKIIKHINIYWLLINQSPFTETQDESSLR